MKNYPWRKSTGLTRKQLEAAKELTDTTLGEPAAR